MRKKLRTKNWVRPVVIFFLLVASLRCIHAASTYSKDLNVYWNAVNVWLQGGDPYSPIHADDPAFVFKYPPWFLPVLIPLHFLTLEATRVVWAVLGVGAIAFSCNTLVSLGVRWSVVLTAGFMFWYIWLGHFFFGQINLFVLASALWVIRKGKSASWEGSRLSLLAFLLSAKAFSLFSLLGLWGRVLRRRVIAGVLGAFFLSHFVLVMLPSPVGGLRKVIGFYHSWIVAMGSGATQLGPDIIRGQANHGFVAGLLRWIDPLALRPSLDVVVFLILAVVFGGAWAVFARRLSPAERWAGWLACGVMVHPLAWHHSFVLTFPLAVYALNAAHLAQRHRRWLILGAVVGIALIGLIVPNVIGSWVRLFELGASKSWGVLVCGGVLVFARSLDFYGRGGGIRTHDPLHPMQVR